MNTNSIEKKYLKSLLFLILAGIILSGCIPSVTTINLTPTDEDIQWLNGIQMINRRDSGIAMQVGYIECRNNLLSFNFFIQNTSDRPVLIDPAKFQCTYHNFPVQDSVKPDARKVVSFALDPELQIEDLNIQISQENENYSVSKTLDVAGSFIGLISSIASVGKEKSEEQVKNEDAEAEDNRQRIADRENDHINRIESLNNRKYTWQTQALRKTTLLANQSIEGNIYFNFHDEPGYLQFRFPIDSTSFEIIFKQRIIYQ